MVPLCHMEFLPGKGWQETPPMDSPILPIRLEVHQPTYVARIYLSLFTLRGRVLCSNTLLDLLSSKQGLTSHHNFWKSV